MADMNLEQIARRLGNGNEKKSGDSWLTCCPAHDDSNPSLSLSNGNGSLLWKCHTGCSQEAVKAALDSLGLLDVKESKSLPQHIWEQSTNDNQAIKAYLERRAIFTDIPSCLKLNKYKGQTMIVAKVTKPGDTTIEAIHRTYLSDDGLSRTDRKMLGDCAGRGIYFDGMKAEQMIVGEGIETTLSARQAMKLPAVAGMSDSLMKTIELPRSVTEIFIMVDSDPQGAGQRAAIELAESFKGKAWLVTPDDSCFTDNPKKLDFNDLDPDDIRKRFEKKQTVDQISGQSGQSGQSDNLETMISNRDKIGTEIGTTRTTTIQIGAKFQTRYASMYLTIQAMLNFLSYVSILDTLTDTIRKGRTLQFHNL